MGPLVPLPGVALAQLDSCFSLSFTLYRLCEEQEMVALRSGDR